MRGAVSNTCFRSGACISDIWPFRPNMVDIIIGQTNKCIISNFNCVQWLFDEFRIGNDNHFATFIKVVILQGEIQKIPFDICENTTLPQVTYNL
jgi:hypothetical protein